MASKQLSDDSDAILAAAAGGAVAILLATPVLQQPMVGPLGSAVVLALLAWGLWRRWAPRRPAP